MILSNWIAKFVVWAGGIFTPGAQAVTIWPFIFVLPEYKGNKRLIRHEQKHIEQWKRYWIIGFLPVYLWQFFTDGYAHMELENEAREAEYKQ